MTTKDERQAIFETIIVMVIVAVILGGVFVATGCGYGVELETITSCEERARACDLTPEIPGFPVVECVGGRWEVVEDCEWCCWDDLNGTAECDDRVPFG